MTPEQALEELRWQERNPKVAVLEAAARDIEPVTLAADDAAGLAALISAQPQHPQSSDIELYAVRGGKPHYATSNLHLWDSRAPEVEAKRNLEMLHLAPGDMVYVALFGWDYAKVVRWIVPIRIT